MKLPFLQFYPSDYMRDTRALSLSAKGGWVDIMCMLHGSKTRGKLTLPASGWARVMGANLTETEAVLAEIENMQIAEVVRECNGNVTLLSRRMEREAITREQTRLRVMAHRSNKACNAVGNAEITDKKPETRNQKPETIINTAEGVSRETPGADAPQLTLLNGNENGNHIAPKKRKASNLTDAEWLAELKANPAYDGVDIDREHGKAKVWCDANGRTLTRRTFVNWINRSRPMAGASRSETSALQKRAHGYTY